MPTVHRFGPHRFFVWSHENQETGEPPHIHVESADGLAVFWLSPVAVRESWGYTPRQLATIRRVVMAHRTQLLSRWHEFFDR